MSYKLYLGIIFFNLLATYCAYGQDALYIKAGIGVYTLTNFKEFQQELLKGLPVPARIVDDFPATMNYEFGFSHQYDGGMTLGGFIGYYSTGGRIHYADYSGQTSIDQVLSGYRLGMRCAKDLLDVKIRENISPQFFIKLSATYTLFNMTQYLEVGPEHDSETLNFQSLNTGLEPGMSFQIPVFSFLINPEISYEIQIPGKLYFNNGLFLLNQKSSKVTADWSGLRVGISLAKRL